MIKETCSCGAEITVEYRDSYWQRVTVENWRKYHKHEMSTVITIDDVYKAAISAVRTQRQEEQQKVNDHLGNILKKDLESSLAVKDNKVVTVYPPVFTDNFICVGCGLRADPNNLAGDNFDMARFRDKIELIHNYCPGRTKDSDG